MTQRRSVLTLVSVLTSLGARLTERSSPTFLVAFPEQRLHHQRRSQLVLNSTLLISRQRQQRRHFLRRLLLFPHISLWLLSPHLTIPIFNGQYECGRGFCSREDSQFGYFNDQHSVNQYINVTSYSTLSLLPQPLFSRHGENGIIFSMCREGKKSLAKHRSLLF